MTKIYETGTTERVHYARRDDGTWFKRVMIRTPWGYRWTRWKLEPAGKPAGAWLNAYAGKARLPR